MRYAVAIIRYRAPLEEIVAATDAHRSYLRGLHAAGTLLLSGPFDPRTAGFLLLRIADGQQATLDAVRDDDPFWKAGLVNYELQWWNPGVGAEGLEQL